MNRLALAALAAVVGALALPSAAAAHGLVGRSDLPIPESLFAAAAATVLVISFLALATLWNSPKLERGPVRRLFRVPAWLDVACGAIGVALFAALVYAGFAGSQTPTDNILPTSVYVILWCLLVPVSALLGDVFSAFNPWRAVGRAVGWLIGRLSRSAPPEPLEYPDRLGRWPAVVGLLAFGWLELIATDGDKPSVLATLALVYAAVQLVAMSLYGVETWSRRGDTFGVYFGMFAQLSPLTTDDGHIALRRPLSGLTQIRWLPGTVVFVCAAIGVTAFDGGSEGDAFNSARVWMQDAFTGVGASAPTAFKLAMTLGLVASVALVAGFYRLGVLGMQSVDPRRQLGELSRRFAHSLVPIALAYVFAHYFSLVLYQGQAMSYLVSDPLGDGSDLFGTAGAGINYALVSASAIWYVQVAALVVGHVAGLVVAHDRALVDFGHTREAIRSQYWMLAVMVGFTSLGLWLLSEANK